MHPFLVKSLLSIVLLVLSLIGVFTMFETFGRVEKKYDIELLKKIHRLNGFVFILLALFVASLCFIFLFRTRTEPSVRAMFHIVFALAVLLLLGFKVLVVAVYRQFYARLQTAGLILAFFSICMIGTSAGYFLLATKFGSELPAQGTAGQNKDAGMDKAKTMARTDTVAISRGRELYESKCYFCHDAYSNNRIVGPGHKRILKNPMLPVSGKSATPENVAHQIRAPYKNMPSFSYLSEDDVQSLIAFLNTL